jgi:hypothetical protein
MEPLEQLPFTEVDGLILSWFAYLRMPEAYADIYSWKGMKLLDIYRGEYFEEMFRDVLYRDATQELLAAAAASPRFRNLRMFHYMEEMDEDLDKQFAAVTFKIRDGLYYIAFRGTDQSFAGWKEDMNMSLDGPIPSQMAAVRYLETVRRKVRGSLMVGGHSKGGNLASYAAGKCSRACQKRIAAGYSYDGPGFQKEVLEDSGFANVKDRLHKLLPQSSIIGMFFEQECEYEIVKSHERGILQHNPFSWEIVERKFVVQNKLTPDALILCKGINNWIEGLTQEDRELFITSIFDILKETGESDFNEFHVNLQQNIPVIAKKIVHMEKETRQFLLHSLQQLAVSSVKTVPDMIRKEKEI